MRSRGKRRDFRRRFLSLLTVVNPTIDELRGAHRRQAKPSCKEIC